MVHVSRGTWTGSVFEPSWSQIHISSLNTHLRLTEIHWSSSAYDTRVTSKHHGVVFRVQCDFSEKAFLKPPTFLWQIWHFLQDNNEIKWRTMRFLLESHVYLRFLISHGSSSQCRRTASCERSHMLNTLISRFITDLSCSTFTVYL